MVKDDFEGSLLNENFVEVLELALKDLSKYDTESIKNHLEQTPKQDIFKFGVSAFLLFVQQSYTGPTVQWTSHEFLKITEPKNVWDKRYLKLLEKNGEEPYQLTPDPFLLYMASTLLFLEFEDSLKVNWWRARVLFVNQRILDNYSDILKTQTLATFEKIEPLLQNDKSLNAKYYLELGMVHHYYGNHKLGLIQFQKAQKQTGLEFNVTGIMGKRTKFQTFETSQLAITAKSNLKIEDVEQKIVPITHELNDDTLLESIAYTSNDENLKGNLNQIDQCILLAFCLDVKNTNPMDGLTTEQMFPYVLRVLENHNNWMITTMALLLKSRLEGTKSRTVERSCLQLQTLVDQWKFQDKDASVSTRLQHSFGLFVPSKWEMEKELGEKFASIGVIRSALEIFERLELWENCISCHQMLEQGKKADELISRLLVNQPDDPKLLCLLGDVRGDKSLYEKAWELSGKRFSRAMRSLGSYYFSAEDWSLSIECYDKALSINPMFENSWFIMGCSALHIDDFTTAARAFTRVVQIDPDNSEAWNNLASVFIKQKKLQEAFRCLKESTRVNFDSSNIWENYLFVCVDVGAFAEAIRAVQRVFEIRIEKTEMKHRALDEEVFDVLMNCICQGAPDHKGQDSKVYIPQFERLMIFIIEKYGSAKFYDICSEFFKFQARYPEWLEFKEKSYRKLLNDPFVLEQKEVFDKLVEQTISLSRAFYEARLFKVKPKMDDETEVILCKDWAYQAKMALKAVIGRTKSTYEGSTEHELLTEELSFIISESKK